MNTRFFGYKQLISACYSTNLYRLVVYSLFRNYIILEIRNLFFGVIGIKMSLYSCGYCNLQVSETNENWLAIMLAHDCFSGKNENIVMNDDNVLFFEESMYFQKQISFLSIILFAVLYRYCR